MKSKNEIIVISENKIKAAECLLKNGFFDDAYYIAGYSFELLLKAKICKTLSINDFFDFENSKSRKLSSYSSKKRDNDNLYRPFKVHDYEQLIILSGLFDKFNRELANPNFLSNWSTVSAWNENFRYVQGIKKNEVELFIDALKELIKWVSKYL